MFYTVPIFTFSLTSSLPLSPLHHPLLDHLRWIAGAASGRLKLLFAHFVLVLEALFGGHLLEAKKVYFAMFSIAVLSKEIRSSDVPSR